MPWMEQLRTADWNRAGCIGCAAYALGCFATGYYLVRWRTGKDIREVGSGSIGARNVGRLLGRQGFLVTVLCDFGKGALAVWGARYFTTDDRLVTLAVLGVVAGHLWPVQLRFRGGKGMATSLGALLIYDWELAVAFVLLFGFAFAVLKKTVLPGLFALASLPFISLALGRTGAEVIGCSILAGLVLLAHRRNLASEISLLLERRQERLKHDPPGL
jgi:acyl phosphate:glycerol-3-phosphate acyltransferase